MTTLQFPLPSTWTDKPIKIHLVGMGGTGSQTADQLASMEVTLRKLGHPGFEVTCFDGDSVQASNVGRQRFCANDLQQNKAIVLTHRIRLFYGVDWLAVPSHYSVDNRRPDLIITCTDSALFRARLAKANANKVTDCLWLDTGNGNSRGNIFLGHLGKPQAALRIPNVFDLHPELANMGAEDNEAPSCSAEEAIQRQPWPINRMVAILAMEMLWTLIRQGNLTHHGYQLDTNPMSTSPLPIDPVAWEFFGYKAPKKRKKIAA